MPRDWKRDWSNEKARQTKDAGVLEAKMERQRARRKLDKKGVSRDGKDVAHKKALSKGGSNKNGFFLTAPSKNRAFKRSSDHKPKSTWDKP